MLLKPIAISATLVLASLPGCVKTYDVDIRAQTTRRVLHDLAWAACALRDKPFDLTKLHGIEAFLVVAEKNRLLSPPRWLYRDGWKHPFRWVIRRTGEDPTIRIYSVGSDANRLGQGDPNLYVEISTRLHSAARFSWQGICETRDLRDAHSKRRGLLNLRR